MLTQVSINDYKCFGSKGATFNLSKVNFIFGDNSAGKSTMLQFVKTVVLAVAKPEEFADCEKIKEHVSAYPEEGAPDLGAEEELAKKSYAELKAIERKKRIETGLFPERFPYGEFRGMSEVDGSNFRWGFLPDFSMARYILCDVGSLNDDSKDVRCVDVSELDAKMLGNVAGASRCIHLETRQQVAVHMFKLEALSKHKFEGTRQCTNEEKVAFEKEKSRDVEFVDDFLSRVGIEYGAGDDVFGSSPDRIHDKVCGADFELKDVGTGVRGIYKLARNFSKWQSGILEVEEPDANVNERQIAALTRTMVEEALKREHGQLVVECHSKLVALQLAAMVRQGILRMEGPDANLCVMEVRKTPAGSVVDPVKISPNGNITWPSGFFPAEAAILRDLYGVS